MPEVPAITVENLSKTYDTRGGETVTAVDDISFSIPKGSIVGVLGPNGAGKTTLIKSILGLILPDQGSIRIHGTDVHDRAQEAYRYITPILEGARNIYWRLTVWENMNYFAALHERHPNDVSEKLRNYLRVLGLEGHANEPVRNLSRGMKQKAALCCGLARRTPVLLLDEPMLGLDIETSKVMQDKFRELVEQENRTVLLSSHDMDVVESICSRALILNEGTVVADDQIDQLINVFQTQTHRITVEEQLSSSAQNTIEERFEITDLHRGSHRTEFEVVTRAETELVDLVTELDRAGFPPRRIRSHDPDLEEAFLRVTNSDIAPQAETDETPTLNAH